MRALPEPTTKPRRVGSVLQRVTHFSPSVFISQFIKALYAYTVSISIETFLQLKGTSN